MDNAKKPATRAYADCTPLLDAPKKLRAQADRDGFLFFRNALPKDKLLETRKRILQVLDKYGLLDRETPLLDGIANLAEFARYPFESVRKHGGVTAEMHVEIQKIEAFHALSHEPALMKIFSLLYGEKAFPHPRNIARTMIAHPQLTETPPHQDYVYTHGSPLSWTCWFPLGDAPRELGNLSVLAGSHKAGNLPVKANATGTGGLEAVLCDLDYEWVEGDFAIGDILVFNVFTVHKALPHRLKERVRLSLDFRYSPMSEPVDEGALHPHLLDYAAWEELYRDWTRDEFKYYWTGYGLAKSARDPSLFSVQDRLC